MNQSSLLHAVVLNNDGTGKTILLDEVQEYLNNNALIWLHFDYTSTVTQEWINTIAPIDELAKEALLTSETRPRTTIFDDFVLLALRGINFNNNAEPEDMVSIRLYVSEHLIISTQKRNLKSVQDILNYIKQAQGPKNSSEFIIELTHRLTVRMEDTIEDIGERVSELEEKILDDSTEDIRTQNSRLKREIIALKRYLTPQKDAISKLYNYKISWVSDYDKVQLREINDQLIRNIEELDALKDKLVLLQEELSNKISEQINNRMYFLSIISAIFLPLGFLTGLLGINVGGIPGAENKGAFGIFIVILVGLVAMQLYYLKKKKWL